MLLLAQQERNLHKHETVRFSLRCGPGFLKDNLVVFFIPAVCRSSVLSLKSSQCLPVLQMK